MKRTIFVKKWVITFVMLVFTCNVSFAGTSYAEQTSEGVSQAEQGTYAYKLNNKEYWKGYIADTKRILSSPACWDNKDWIKFSLIVGATAGLYAADGEIQRWVQDNRNKTSDDIASFAKVFGEGTYTLPPLGLLYLYGHYYDNEKARKVAMLSLESFVITGIFTQVIKFSSHRHRPSTGDSFKSWDGPGFSSSHLAFPSGHSSSAFAIATVVASEYNDTIYVPLLSYGIATLTALSRVNDDAHWASDVFFGSVIGYVTAKAVVSYHRDEKESRLSLYPLVHDNVTGLVASYKFN